MNESSWQVEYSCPQCGAPVVLDETDRLITCPYCRVRLYLASNDCCHYYLPSADISQQQVFHVPYWRFKGMIFSCQPGEVKSGILDTSSPASSLSGLPPSLGLRPQVLRLRYVSPETEGRFLNPDLSFKKVLSRIEGTLYSIGHPVLSGPNLYKAFVGETVSLIYSPFFIQNQTFYDAILKKPVPSHVKEGIDQLPAHVNRPNWKITFIPTLCPQCGWDLEGERASLVLICRQCDSAWESSGVKLKRIEVASVPDREESFYLPFWRFTTQIAGLKLQSYSDLIRIANLPKLIGKEGHEEGLHLWTPAFKIRPDLFLKLSKLMTVSQPKERLEGNLPKSSLYPVTFPASEAVESLKIALAAIVVANRTIFAGLAKVDVRPTEINLIYFPFTPTGNELIHSKSHFGIHRNALLFGKNL